MGSPYYFLPRGPVRFLRGSIERQERDTLGLIQQATTVQQVFGFVERLFIMFGRQYRNNTATQGKHNASEYLICSCGQRSYPNKIGLPLKRISYRTCHQLARALSNRLVASNSYDMLCCSLTLTHILPSFASRQ